MALAVITALFVWWFSTGAIFWAVSRRNIGAVGLVMLTAPLAVLGFAGLLWSGAHGDATGVYIAFASAILLWGWFELAFLTGVLTGPNRAPCPPGISGWHRFLMAWGTIAHHEIVLVLVSAALILMLGDAANTAGLWTFQILFFARISAKLNVYLGVPNFSHEMLPKPVSHLKSYFSTRRMNWLFPVSISILTFAVAYWIERAIAVPAGSGAETAVALLATLTALALIEHWLMVLPIRDAALWRWMTPKTRLTGLETPDPID